MYFLALNSWCAWYIFCWLGSWGCFLWNRGWERCFLPTCYHFHSPLLGRACIHLSNVLGRQPLRLTLKISLLILRERFITSCLPSYHVPISPLYQANPVSLLLLNVHHSLWPSPCTCKCSTQLNRDLCPGQHWATSVLCSSDLILQDKRVPHKQLPSHKNVWYFTTGNFHF